MTARAALTHPSVLLAIAALAFNDHVLKRAAPGVLSGKLSDVAGMVCFPVLLAFVLDLVRRRDRRRTLVAATVATGITFTAVKLWAPVTELYRIGLGLAQWPVRALAALITHHAVPPLARVQLVRDPTDLVALVALVVPLWLAATVRTPTTG